jgi:hypothetical protein
VTSFQVHRDVNAQIPDINQPTNSGHNLAPWSIVSVAYLEISDEATPAVQTVNFGGTDDISNVVCLMSVGLTRLHNFPPRVVSFTTGFESMTLLQKQNAFFI